MYGTTGGALQSQAGCLGTADDDVWYIINATLILFPSDPNPVFDILNVEMEGGSNYKIVNLFGQQVLSGKATKSIDVSTLPQGTYIFVVGLKQVKFIKM